MQLKNASNALYFTPPDYVWYASHLCYGGQRSETIGMPTAIGKVATGRFCIFRNICLQRGTFLYHRRADWRIWDEPGPILAKIFGEEYLRFVCCRKLEAHVWDSISYVRPLYYSHSNYSTMQCAVLLTPCYDTSWISSLEWGYHVNLRDLHALIRPARELILL